MKHDYNLDFSDQSRWIERFPDEKARLKELRIKQDAGYSNPETWAKWEQVLRYMDKAERMVSKKGFKGARAQDMTQDMLITMFKQGTGEKRMKGISEDLAEAEKVRAWRESPTSFDEGNHEFMTKSFLGWDFWETYHVKACLLTGKQIPISTLSPNLTAQAVLDLAEKNPQWHDLDERVYSMIEEVDNQAYREALLAIIRGQVETGGGSNPAAKAQSRALSILTKLLNGTWSSSWTQS